MTEFVVGLAVLVLWAALTIVIARAGWAVIARG